MQPFLPLEFLSPQALTKAFTRRLATFSNA
jgi:hypothetical protein